MPPLVRRYLKTAIGYLMFGLGLGLYMLVRRELGGVWPTLWWVSAHTHAILVGFVMMMILGSGPLDVSSAGQGRPAVRYPQGRRPPTGSFYAMWRRIRGRPTGAPSTTP